MELNEKEKALVDHITEQMKRQTAGMITKDQMEAAIAEKTKELEFDLSDDESFKSLKKALETIGLELKSMKETGKPQYKSVRDQIKEQIEARAEEFKQFRNKALQTFELTIKTAGEMLESTNTGSPAFTPSAFEPGYTMPMRKKPSIIQMVNNGSTDSATYTYIQLVNPDGDAAITADGTIAPLIDFDLAKVTSTAVDITDRVDISEDMLDDFSGLANIIENELRYKVDIAADAAVLAVIIAAASAFTQTDIEVEKPNTIDAIRAAATQIEATAFGKANLVAMNPVDFMNMVSSKDSTANYVMLPIVTFLGTQIDDLMVYKSSDITAGNILVMDGTKVHVLELKSFSAQIGYIANNFTEFVQTIRGKRRLHKFVKSNEAGAIVYDAISDIKTAITAV